MTAVDAPGFWRLFIAMAVPLDVRKAIARAQEQLRRCAPPGSIRWTSAEQFHLTLKFLGDVTPDQAMALRDPLAQICEALPPAQLFAQGLGSFPHTRQPRVIWAGVDDAAGWLTGLHRQIELAMRPYAPTENPEKFSAHITLGRIKPGRHGSLKPVWDRALTLRDQTFGAWLADEMVVYHSRLTSERAVHEPFYICRLAG
jgi:2'-5' RNA ligase